MNLLIRADANARMGIGHVARCLALAQAWQAAYGRVVLLSNCPNVALRRQVEAAGVGFVPLEKPYPDSEDLRQTLVLLEDLCAEWIVLDGYHFDPSYQQTVQETGCRSLVIDDIVHWPQYYADVLMNQNINANELAYRCGPETIKLLGTQYALLRSEFLPWRDWQRKIPATARKILVTLGGGDVNNVTFDVIRALQQIDVLGLEVKVIVGTANPHLGTLRQAVQTSPGYLQLLTEVSNMPELMAWADLAVSAGGSTSWELAFMGVPSILVITANNQCDIAEGLEQSGMAINLGWFDSVSIEKIAETLMLLLDDCEKRRQMSLAGQRLVDGEGASRVIETMRMNSIIKEQGSADTLAG